MAIRCIDVSENKRLDAVSPVASIAMLLTFVILTAVMDLGIFWLIAVVTGCGFSYIMFQYQPRYIFISIKYLFVHYYLTPLYEDEQHVDLNQINNLDSILKQNNSFENDDDF